jgi:hypothetical protein
MMKWEDEIKQKLEKLDAIPERNPLKVQSAKKNFLSEARQLAGESTVSVPRKSWWNQNFVKKETFSMKLITIATILSLLLGGGITAVAAQDSLPGDVLYPVKTLVEDIELGLATTPDSEFEVGFKHANQRFVDIQAALEADESIDMSKFMFKFYNGLQETLEVALATEDPTGNLLKVQQLLQNQHQTAQQNQGEVKGPFENKNFEIYKLQYFMKLVDAGILEPELLASELEFMAQYSGEIGTGNLEGMDQWMYMYGTSEEYDTGQVQNQGLVPSVGEPFMWMHLNGEFSNIDPGGIDQGGTEGGAQNSNNDQPNGGNQGDNDNGNNGGSGSNSSNGGGAGGK